MNDAEPDLYSLDYQEDPAPVLHRLRAADPVHKTRHGYWFLTRYDDVKAVLRDPRFSSDWSAREGKSAGSRSARFPETDRDRANRALILSSFNMKDGPAHARIRTLVNHAFTLAQLEKRRGQVEALTDDILDSLGDRESFDLVKDLGFPIPMLVGSEILGIPSDQRERFRTSFEEAGLLGHPARSPEQHARGLRALDWQVSFVRELAESRRAEPRDDLISGLVHAEEAGDRLGTDEVVAAVVTIFTAAGTTTERFISSGLLLLMQHPDAMEALRADRSLLPSALEEMLRFHHPDQSTTTPRWVTEDVVLRDKTLAPGDRVRLSLGAANRDPEQFPEPDRFDIARDPNRHLAFGRGAHFCLGAMLARLEGGVAISRVLDRFGGLELLTPNPRRDPRRPDRYEEIRVRPRA